MKEKSQEVKRRRTQEYMKRRTYEEGIEGDTLWRNTRAGPIPHKTLIILHLLHAARLLWRSCRLISS